jgi:outer membrane protein assembly factor BamB
VAVLGGALLALLAGGGVVLVSATGDGDSDGDGDRDGRRSAGREEPGNVMAERWRSQPVETWGDDPGRVWLSEGTVTLLTGGGVWGFDRESGERLWRLEPPEGAEPAPCAASEEANGQGVGAVLYQAEDDEYDNCSLLAAVDTHSGEVMWSQDLAEPGDVMVGANIEVPVTVGERVIAVDPPGGSRATLRFAAEDGDELPQPEPPLGPECETFKWEHTAEYVVAYSECTPAGDNENQLTTFDTETGTELWTRSADWFFGHEFGLQADDPLTFGSDAQLLLHDGAAVRSEIPLEYIDYDEVEIGSAEDRVAYETVDYAVTESLVITRSANDNPSPDIVRGFDPETGEELWQREFSEENYLFHYVDEEPLVSYEAEVAGGRTFSHIAWLDPGDGGLSVEGVLPQDTNLTSIVGWDDDALYVTDLDATGRSLRLQVVDRNR